MVNATFLRNQIEEDLNNIKKNIAALERMGCNVVVESGLSYLHSTDESISYLNKTKVSVYKVETTRY